MTLTPEAWLPDGAVEPVAPTSDFAEVEPTPPPRRFPFDKPMLRYGLPVAVVGVSLFVVLAIAGVFSHSGVTRPGVPPLPPTTVQPNGAASPVTAKPRVIGRKRPNKHVTSANKRPQKAAVPPGAARNPAPRRAIPVTPTRTPVPATPTPAPAPLHHAPSPPQHATPAPTTKTRPTQRSGAPGRQPTSG